MTKIINRSKNLLIMGWHITLAFWHAVHSSPPPPPPRWWQGWFSSTTKETKRITTMISPSYSTWITAHFSQEKKKSSSKTSRLLMAERFANWTEKRLLPSLCFAEQSAIFRWRFLIFFISTSRLSNLSAWHPTWRRLSLCMHEHIVREQITIICFHVNYHIHDID